MRWHVHAIIVRSKATPAFTGRRAIEVPLEELVPLYRDPKSSFPITQFNWKMVEGFFFCAEAWRKRASMSSPKQLAITFFICQLFYG